MELRDADMQKLAEAFFKNLQRDDCEFGAIGVDCKRPFGNSFVEGDILTIIEAERAGNDGECDCWSEEQLEYARAMYDGLIGWLQAKYI
jgi:hypothetical protein